MTPPRQSQSPGTEKGDAQQAQPLTEPIPRITTILVSPERRFAMLDGGRVVTVGDSIGPRVVSAIEPRAVVLREPSGVQIRVGLGGRVMGIEKNR